MKTIPALMILLMLASGCSVKKHDMPDAAKDMPQKYPSGDSSSVSQNTGKWWESFGDETLNSLIEEALKSNLDVSLAIERFRQFEAVSGSVSSLRYPTVNLEASAVRARQQGFFGTDTTDNYRLSVSAGYEIDLWRKLGSKAKAARLDALASKEDLESLYMGISAQVADLYYLTVEQRAQLEFSEKTIALLQDTLERIEKRYGEGVVSSLDVYQARQNVAAAKARRTVFESNLAVSKNALSVLSGRFPDEKIGGVLAVLPTVQESFAYGLPSDLLVNRPDIEAAMLRLRASNEQAAAQAMERFPSFNLAASYGGSSSSIGSILDSESIIWNILLKAVQPVFDGGRRKAETRRAEAVFRENLIRYHQSVLRAFREVEDALVRNTHTEEQIRLLEERVYASGEALRIATERYLQGLSDYLPVLTSQQFYYESESGLLSARRQLISDRIQLARAVGGRWMAGEAEERLASKKGEERKNE